MAAKDLELLYDIYFVGLPGHNTMQFNDEAEKDTEHKPLLRSLTSLVPEARVFEFTLFEAGPTSNKNALSANGFSNEAYRLLDAIREKTLSWNKWGTVLLVGYGLGGIIIKQALILANSNPRYYDVAVSTSDIVFISTPHIAPTLDTWESLLDKMVSANGIKLKGWKTSILSVLATLVESTSSDFYCIASRYHVSNFLDRAGLDLLVNQLCNDTLSGDSLIKNFALTTDDAVVNLAIDDREAQELLRDSLAPPRLLNIDSWFNEDVRSNVVREDFINCLQLIAPSRWLIHEANLGNLTEEAVDLGMYHDQIKGFSIDASPGTNSIHIIGPPGHGKSTLMKLLTQRIRRQFKKAVVLDVLAGLSPISMLSTESVLLSLTHQLLSQVPSLFRCLRNFYVDHAEEPKWNGDTLWAFILELFRHNRKSKVIILSSNINDLAPDITDLSRRLLLYLSSIGANYIYISSGKGKDFGQSEYPDGLTDCATPRVIIDVGKAADTSLNKFLETQLNDLAITQGNGNVAIFKDTILKSLIPFHGSFTTAKLYIKQLSQKFSLSTAEALELGLKEWPRTEEQIYKQSIADLEKKGSQILNWCRLAVSWTLQAQRPLRVQELAAAVAIKERGFDIAHMHSSISVSIADDIQRHLSMILRLENQVVYPMSSSVKGSFIVADTTAIVLKQQQADQNTKQEIRQQANQQTFRLLSHGELATLCLEYLTQLLGNIEALGVSWTDCLAQVSWKYETWSRKSPILDFLGYAATQWPVHYRLADADAALDSNVMAMLKNTGLVTKWYKLYHRNIYRQIGFEPDNPTIRQISNELDFPRILASMKDEHTSDSGVPVPRSLLVSEDDHDTVDIDVLVAAVHRNDVEMLKTLLQPLDISGTHSNVITALNMAAQQGCFDAVKVLLEYSSASATDEQGRTSLHQAVIGGESRTINLLLDKDGININARDYQGRTPLILAARAGLIRVVRTLVNEHPDLDLTDETGWTALHYAVHDGEEMVTVLLDQGADPTILNTKSQSALLIACGLGLLDVAKKLVNALNKKPDAQINIWPTKGKSPLQAAAESGHLDIVKFLLSFSSDSLVQTRLDESLVAAASSGHVAIVRQLLANIDSKNISTARQEALYHASGAGHALMVEYLIDEGAQNDLQALERSPIAFATENGHVEVVRALIRQIRDIDMECSSDYSPLSEIVRRGWTDVVRALLNKGADPNYLDKARWTPLHIAAHYGYVRIAELLIGRGAFINSYTRDRYAALHLAVQHPAMVNLLLSSGADVDPQDEDGETPLHHAICQGFDDTISILLDRARLDLKNDNHETPLHYAIKYGTDDLFEKIWTRKSDVNTDVFETNPPLVIAAQARNVNALRFLLGRDPAALHTTNPSGETALHAAAQKGDDDAVAILLENGAEVNRVNKRDQTPLHYAASNEEDNVHVVSTLLEKGADWAREARDLSTPLHAAADQGNIGIVKVLLEAAAKKETIDKRNLVDKQDIEGRTPLYFAASNGNLEVVKTLVKNHADVNKPDNDGKTPLFRAAYLSNLEIVKILIENQAEIDIADNLGWTPLHAGADDVEMTRFLLDKGANVNAPDNDQWTPLMRATQWGRSESVKELLDEEADVNSRCSDGITALHIALNGGARNIVDQLLRAGIRVTDKFDDTPSYLEIAATRDNGQDLLDALLEWQDEVKEALWSTKDRITAIWKAYDEGQINSVNCLLKREKDRDVTNCRSSEGHTLLEAALLDGLWSFVPDLLKFEVDPFLRKGDGHPSAFEMIPLYPFSEKRKELFKLCLSKLGADLAVLGDGFKALRAALEIGSEAGWEKLKPLYKPASLCEDDDRWTLNHLLYQLGGDTVWWVDPVPKLPEKKTLSPTCLKSPQAWFQRNRVSEFEIISDLEVRYTGNTGDSINVRADHAFPPRDMGLSYFEIEILKNEGPDSGTVAGIGLCGEFDDLRDSWPGWLKGTVGFHGDGVIMEEGEAVCYPQTYAEGDTIGCGVNGKNGTYYFTLNGRVVYNSSNKLVYRKQYPVIAMSTMPCIIRAKFGPGGFVYDAFESDGSS